MSARDTCSLCPRLCRHACPVATGSAREAAVPAVIAGALRDWELGRLGDEVARAAATLCTDCGACQEHCHLHMPLPDYLRSVRVRLLPMPAVAPLLPIDDASGAGPASVIVVEADDRPLAAAVAARLGSPVRRWVTHDRFGVDARDYAGYADHTAAIAKAVGSAEVWVADGGAMTALTRAGVSVRWVHEALSLDLPAVGSCVTGGERPLACCGGAGPLVAAHPGDAARVAHTWHAREPGPLRDARCCQHLRQSGIAATDLVDVLLSGGVAPASGDAAPLG